MDIGHEVAFTDKHGDLLDRLICMMSVPRKGEEVQIGLRLYRVKDVTWVICDNAIDHAVVLLKAKKKEGSSGGS